VSPLPTLDTLSDEEHELHRVSEGMDEQKGPRPDDISPSLLRKLVSVVKVLLTLLFNLSLSTCIFPAVRRKSYVVSIFKSGSGYLLLSWDIHFVGDTGR
jgi:hypothetical protein